MATPQRFIGHKFQPRASTKTTDLDAESNNSAESDRFDLEAALAEQLDIDNISYNPNPIAAPASSTSPAPSSAASSSASSSSASSISSGASSALAAALGEHNFPSLPRDVDTMMSCTLQEIEETQADRAQRAQPDIPAHSLSGERLCAHCGRHMSFPDDVETQLELCDCVADDVRDDGPIMRELTIMRDMAGPIMRELTHNLGLDQHHRGQQRQQHVQHLGENFLEAGSVSRMNDAQRQEFTKLKAETAPHHVAHLAMPGRARANDRNDLKIMRELNDGSQTSGLQIYGQERQKQTRPSATPCRSAHPADPLALLPADPRKLIFEFAGQCDLLSNSGGDPCKLIFEFAGQKTAAMGERCGRRYTSPHGGPFGSCRVAAFYKMFSDRTCMVMTCTFLECPDIASILATSKVPGAMNKKVAGFNDQRVCMCGECYTDYEWSHLFRATHFAVHPFRVAELLYSYLGAQVFRNDLNDHPFFLLRWWRNVLSRYMYSQLYFNVARQVQGVDRWTPARTPEQVIFTRRYGRYAIHMFDHRHQSMDLLSELRMFPRAH